MSEWRFKRDTAFRKLFFVPDSWAHPAKMDAQLLIKIVETYTEAGDTILDPMAGSGTTMLACTLGRNCILVELEEKFCKMIRDNWEQVKMRPQLGSTMGECQIIQGDARQLEGLLCDKIITSPPFFNTSIKKKFKTEEEIIEFAKKTKLYKEGRSLEAIVRMIKKNWNADEGLVDKIVTSPPFASATFVSDFIPPHDSTKLHHSEYAPSKENIGNLPYGEIDKCIFSPPYEASVNVPDSKQDARAERLRKAGYDPKKYQGGKGRNLQQDWNYGQIDKIVTSPPYEGSLTAEAKDKGWDKLAEDPTSNRYGRQSVPSVGAEYSSDQANIGNFKSQSYLEAMLQVYQQCYKVLKPEGGLLILVTKNFIRNKQVVRLDTDTIKLCEQAGFSFAERHYRKLPSLSFWRVTYAKKYPDLKHLIEQLWYEDILVFKK